MTHWTSKYLSLPSSAEMDCADFVVLIAREEFNHALILPQHATGIRDRDAQITALAATLTTRTDHPAEGDGVLMRALGRRHTLGHHIGIYAAPSGCPHVIHLLPTIGPRLHCIRSLPIASLELEGYYRFQIPQKLTPI